MCYDISVNINIRELADYFPGLIFDNQIEMNFSPLDHAQGVSVFTKVPIIYINRQDMKEHCALMEWGVIPYYSSVEPQMMDRNKYLNARSERIIDDKKSYWSKIRNRRCLFPVPGIYEHREVKGWKKKVPYFIKPKDQKIFFAPGLYSVWEEKDEDGTPVKKRYTVTLITRAANDVMKLIHNHGENKYRMPLFLPLNMSKEFLSEELSSNEARYKEILNYEMPSENLDYHPVWTIRTPKLRPDHKNSKEEYFEWEGLPALGEAMPD